MPRRDGTGPMGLGPMTGRKRGSCAGFRFAGFFAPPRQRFIDRRRKDQGWQRVAKLIPNCAYLAYRQINHNNNK